jgi:hypothetical protein
VFGGETALFSPQYVRGEGRTSLADSKLFIPFPPLFLCGKHSFHLVAVQSIPVCLFISSILQSWPFPFIAAFTARSITIFIVFSLFSLALALAFALAFISLNFMTFFRVYRNFLHIMDGAYTPISLHDEKEKVASARYSSSDSESGSTATLLPSDDEPDLQRPNGQRWSGSGGGGAVKWMVLGNGVFFVFSLMVLLRGLTYSAPTTRKFVEAFSAYCKLGSLVLCDDRGVGMGWDGMRWIERGRMLDIGYWMMTNEMNSARGPCDRIRREEIQRQHVRDVRVHGIWAGSRRCVGCHHI